MDQQSHLALQSNNLLKNVDLSKLNFEKFDGKLHAMSGGDIIYRAGDAANSVFLVVNGEINLLKKKSDLKSTSIVYGDNEFFGAKELLHDNHRGSTSVSLTDSYLIEISKEGLNSLINQSDIISHNINENEYSFESSASRNLKDSDVDFDSDFNEESELLEDFINENNINDIINSIDEQEKTIIDNYSEFDENNTEVGINIEDLPNRKKDNDNVSPKHKHKKEKTMESVEIKTEKEFMTAEQFEMIVKALQLVNANVKKDDVLKNIIDVAVDLTNADRGTLYLVDNEKKEIWSKVLMGKEISEIRLKIGDGLAGYVAESGEILNIKDVKLDGRFDSSFDNITGYTTKNMLVYPIKDKKEDIVGVLQLLNSHKGEFSNQEKMFLNAISLNIAFALENASLVEQLVKTERNNSLGKMGNFIAYDLKKPILVSKRYAEHLKKKDLPIDIKQIVNLMLEQLDQVSNQIGSTSDFTEGTTLLRRQAVSLSDTLHSFVIDAYSLVSSKKCKLEYSFEEDVDVYIDRKELISMLLQCCKKCM